MTDAPSGERPAAAAAPPPTKSREHRWSVRALLTLGSVLLFLSIFAVWANRQLLNADNWTETSSQLIADPAIQTQVADYVVDQLYANVDVTGEVRSGLPPRLAPLAGAAAGGLRNLAERTTAQALNRPRVQEAWKVANRVAATHLIAIVKGESTVAQVSGDDVILDLRPIMLEVAARLGVPDSLTSKIPESAAKVTVLHSDQLSTVQDAASLLDALATIIPVIALACLALAVFLARGRRRTVLLWTGVNLAAAGILALVARTLAGNYVVDALTTTEAVRPAAESAWSIGTRILADVAQALIIASVPLIVAALLAGPSRAATAIRRALAPWLLHRPGVIYVGEAVLVLLVVAWGPIPATQKVVPVLVMVSLLILGVEVLRRQVAREFPDVTEADTRAAVAARARRAREAIGRRHRTGNGAAPEEDSVERLERLAELHERGALSDAEFDSAKRALLPH